MDVDPSVALPTPAVLAAMICEALHRFGGEAHRTSVIAEVAYACGYERRRAPPALEVAVIRTFDRFRAEPNGLPDYAFHLRFGEGSYRWSLAPKAAPKPLGSQKLGGVRAHRPGGEARSARSRARASKS